MQEGVAQHAGSLVTLVLLDALPGLLETSQSQCCRFFVVAMHEPEKG